MADENLTPCAYRILRYTPNLVRDEWINIGIVLFDPARKRARVRLIEEPGEFARVRRLHGNMDEDLLRMLGADFERQLHAHGGDAPALLAKLDETLSNVLQLSPQRGVLTADLDAELERLYRDHITPPRLAARAADAGSRNAIRARITDEFRSAGIYERTEHGVSVAAFTCRGDPMKLDFAYRRNGTRGFVHAVPIGRDPGPAKVLAFTAERIRSRMAASEFTAVTEVEPQPENERHQFVAELLAQQVIDIVPLMRLPEYARGLRAKLA